MLPSLAHPESLRSSSRARRRSTPHTGRVSSPRRGAHPRATSAASACRRSPSCRRACAPLGRSSARRASAARAAAELRSAAHRSGAGRQPRRRVGESLHARTPRCRRAHERAAPTQGEAGECAGLPADVGLGMRRAAAHLVAHDVTRAQQARARAPRADAQSRRPQSSPQSAARSDAVAAPCARAARVSRPPPRVALLGAPSTYRRRSYGRVAVRTEPAAATCAASDGAISGLAASGGRSSKHERIACRYHLANAPPGRTTAERGGGGPPT